ncbi:MAG: hypothetical protein ACI814_002697 [Mariniblastus sp.]|jgi:hypothetical protein
MHPAKQEQPVADTDYPSAIQRVAVLRILTEEENGNKAPDDRRFGLNRRWLNRHLDKSED